MTHARAPHPPQPQPWPQPRPPSRTRPLVASLARRGRRFLRDESGVATIEFVLLSPLFFALFLSSFETGMLMMRQAMLDRAVDLTVREIRLGNFDTVPPAQMHDAIKMSLCGGGEGFGSLAACTRDLKLEMQPMDPHDWAMMEAEVDCVNRRDANSIPATNFTPGIRNELMVVRACQVYDPFFPTFGLGKMLSRTAPEYALVSSTAYVIEPS